MADDQEMAESITSKLLSNLQQQEPRDSFLPPSDIVTTDVEASVDRFRLQLRWHRAVGVPFPCLRLSKGGDPPIPVEAGYLLWSEFVEWRFSRGYPYPGDLWGTTSGILEPSEPEKAVQFLGQRLVRFLTTRLSARRSISKNPGLTFTVHTKAHGLRIHYSPAYFLSMNHVFGNSLSTPVSSEIQPGRYLFGVQAPADLSPKFDAGEYDIPPLKEAHLVIA